jgi:cytochrome c6
MKLMKSGAIALAAVLACGITTSAYAQDDAAALYKSKCAACHGADGKGDTVMGKKLEVKDFHAPECVKESDADFFKVVKEGKGKMPAYDKKLTDDQIKSLIKYVRTLK